MNYDLNKFDEREFKSVYYDVVSVGQEFYTLRPRLDSQGKDDTPPFKKIPSIKNAKGVWVNAQDKLGNQIYIAYDRKVFIFEK